VHGSDSGFSARWFRLEKPAFGLLIRESRKKSGDNKSAYLKCSRQLLVVLISKERQQSGFRQSFWVALSGASCFNDPSRHDFIYSGRLVGVVKGVTCGVECLAHDLNRRVI
jgi:hypothetical protein